MPFTLRRLLPTGLMMALLAGAWAVPVRAETTLKVIPQASLRVLDPIWTTAYLTRNHGYLVYDTLFALDANFKVQPQMVDTWTVSDNGLTYTFTLRPGLKFHDGALVTSRDVIASIKRWGVRDLFGQKLMSYTQSMDAVSEATFTITLKEPFALVLDALAKPSSNVLFIMPERVANTDPQKQIEDYTGSGPFVFVKEEFNPGSKSVYRKFADYVPLYAMRYLHGTPDAARLAMRAMALQWNFHPYGARTRRADPTRRSPFHDLNGFEYHPNWLHNLLIASSMGGRKL